MGTRAKAMTLIEGIIVLILLGFFLLLVLNQVLVRFPESQTRSHFIHVKTEFRTASALLAAYRVDHGALPPSRTDAGTESLDALPLEIQEKLKPDPFAKKNAQSYRYYSRGDRWALVSPGPDKDHDLLAPDIYRAFDNPTDTPYILNIYDPTNGAISNGDVVLLSDEEKKS